MKPDVIVIAASHEEDVLAGSADVWVSVHGSSLFTGRAALRKAKEVSELVTALQQAGFPEEDISLASVRAQVRVIHGALMVAQPCHPVIAVVHGLEVLGECDVLGRLGEFEAYQQVPACIRTMRHAHESSLDLS